MKTGNKEIPLSTTEQQNFENVFVFQVTNLLNKNYGDNDHPYGLNIPSTTVFCKNICIIISQQLYKRPPTTTRHGARNENRSRYEISTSTNLPNITMRVNLKEGIHHRPDTEEKIRHIKSPSRSHNYFFGNKGIQESWLTIEPPTESWNQTLHPY